MSNKRINNRLSAGLQTVIICSMSCVFVINHLTPNGHYTTMGRTAQLTSRCYILCIHSTNTRTEYFKHAA